MGDTIKTKAAMLNELESIKGLLLEADEIPILQEEVLEPRNAIDATPTHKSSTEDQHDFFYEQEQRKLSTLPLEQKHPSERPHLAKALGENPFLPEHIRSRLHGNNPPPLFAAETAQKIATSNNPSRQLGNTFTVASSARTPQQEMIESIVVKILPELEKELRSRLALMSDALLNDLHK